MWRMLFGSLALVAVVAIGLATAEEPRPKAPPVKPGSTPPGKPLRFDVEGFLKDYDRNKDGHLTRDELPPELRAAFDRLDTNKDGKISREELEHGVAHLHPPRRPSDFVYILIEMSDCDEQCAHEVQRAYDILRKLDKNNNGKIDPDELKAAREQIVKDRVDHLFKQLDANKDGKISREEARGMVRQNFDEIDRNKDGFITKQEMLEAAMEKPKADSGAGVTPRPKSDRPPDR
jgi:Ca2+-binding EF-hand superfamily protein